MFPLPLKVALNTTHVVLPHEQDWVKQLPVWFPWVSLTDNLAEADVILHTFFDEEWRDYPDAIAVEYVWENVAPDFNHADYAISFSRLTYGDRHLRYPLFCYLPEFHALFAEDGTVIPFDAHAEAGSKTCFCTAVVSNPNRDGACARLFDLLSAHKPVTSGGKWRNSFGGKRVDDKIAFLRTGKFTLGAHSADLLGRTECCRGLQPRGLHRLFQVPLVGGRRGGGQASGRGRCGLRGDACRAPLQGGPLPGGLP